MAIIFGNIFQKSNQFDRWNAAKHKTGWSWKGPHRLDAGKATGYCCWSVIRCWWGAIPCLRRKSMGSKTRAGKDRQSVTCCMNVQFFVLPFCTFAASFSLFPCCNAILSQLVMIVNHATNSRTCAWLSLLILFGKRENGRSGRERRSVTCLQVMQNYSLILFYLSLRILACAIAILLHIFSLYVSLIPVPLMWSFVIKPLPAHLIPITDTRVLLFLANVP